MGSVIAVLLAGFLVGPRVPTAAAQGATIINEFGCAVVPADWGGPIILETHDTHTVLTPSGKSLLLCKFAIPPGLEPARAVVRGGFLCATYLGLTTRSHAVASPGGTITLTCHR
jgi:hypothetical protein